MHMQLSVIIFKVFLLIGITVGSAGAAFVYDGPGNVDMLTWVTMTEEGPEIAGIALKGIFDRKGLDPVMFGAYDRAPLPGHDPEEIEYIDVIYKCPAWPRI